MWGFRCVKGAPGTRRLCLGSHSREPSGRSVQDPGGNRLVSPGVFALEAGDGDEFLTDNMGGQEEPACGRPLGAVLGRRELVAVAVFGQNPVERSSTLGGDGQGH